MEDRIGIFLRDIFLKAFENIREDDTEDDRTYHEIMSGGIKKAKEGFIDSSHVLHTSIRQFDDHPSVQEHYLSSAYAIELVSLIPDASLRAMEIISSMTYADLDDIARQYIEQACKSYIYGLYLSSLVMCRASIEYSFHKKLKYNISKRKRPNIYELIMEAKGKGYISAVHEEIVLDIYGMASKCVHGREQFDPEMCLSALNKTKNIIAVLLSNAI